MVIPVALRRLLAIQEGDVLEIGVADGQLVMRKIAPECAICGRDDALVDVHAKHVCRECVNAIRFGPEGAEIVELDEPAIVDGCGAEIGVL